MMTQVEDEYPLLVAINGVTMDGLYGLCRMLIT